MRRHRARTALATLLLLAAAVLALSGLLAGAALADTGGMSSMPGMTDEQMQNMTTPAPATAAATPAPAATAMSSGSMSGMGGTQTGKLGPAMDPTMDMSKGTVNWLVIGGFVALVVASTLGAMATKRHLGRRMATGELAGAGALDV
jgi:hypothetical protein